jgi:hypothetical protein
LPAGFETFTDEQCRQWLRSQIEHTAMEMFNDLAEATGVTPTRAMKAAYLRNIQPGIDQAVGGSGA